MRVFHALGLCCALAFAPFALGQTTQPSQPGETVISQVEHPTDWAHRPTLTGDWGGVRKELEDKGISVKLGLTQMLMGNAHGGAHTNNGLRYSGSGDLTILLDTQKMGLWEGGMLLLNAEPKWGDGIQSKAGSLMPVNLDAFKPGFNEGCQMTLSEWIYFQNLFGGKLTLIGGKLDGSRAFDTNVFANDERTQFMNGALRNNMIIPSFLPYTNLGAGFIVRPADWVQVVTAVADSEGRAKTTGFETAFHGPTHTTVIHEWDFKIKPFDLPGNQRFGFVWSSKEFEHLQPPSPFGETGPMVISLMGPRLANMLVRSLTQFETSPDNVAVYYNFDQYVYTEQDDPTQGVGVFGRFGWAREDVNPINYFYSFGVGGKGIIPDRDCDTFGVGMYYLNLSNKLPPMFNQESGFEAYYNIQITPWLHISPDVQVLCHPGGGLGNNDTALVYGFRVQMDL